MDYKEQLKAHSNDNHPYQGEERAQQIADDLRHAFDDGSAFGDYISSTVGAAMAAFIEKSGLDAFVNDKLDDLRLVVNEAVNSAITNDEFTSGLGLNLAQKEVSREMASWQKDQQEMGG